MKNITLSLPDDLYERVKAAAHDRKTSINAYVREKLESELVTTKAEWVEKNFELIHDFKVSFGKKVSREEMNERR